MTDDSPTLLVTLTGDDRPGVTSALFHSLAEAHVDVLDVEQVLVRGHLTLAVLLDPHGREDAVRAIVQRTAFDLAMTATVSLGQSRRPCPSSTAASAGSAWSGRTSPRQVVSPPSSGRSVKLLPP